MASVFDVDSFRPICRNSSSKILSSPSLGHLGFSNSETAAIMRLGYDVAPTPCAPNGCIVEDVSLVTTKTTMNDFDRRSFSTIAFPKKPLLYNMHRHLNVDCDMDCDKTDNFWEQEEPLDFSFKNKNSGSGTKSLSVRDSALFNPSSRSTVSSPPNPSSVKDNGDTNSTLTVTSRDLIRSKLESKLLEMRELNALRQQTEMNGHAHSRAATVMNATSEMVISKINGGAQNGLPELLRVKPTGNTTSLMFPRHLSSPGNGDNSHNDTFGPVLASRDENGLQHPRQISAFNGYVTREDDHHLLDSAVGSRRQRPSLMTSLNMFNSGTATSSSRSPLLDNYDKSLVVATEDILSKPTPPIVRPFKTYSTDHMLPLTYYALSSNLQLPFLSSPTGASDLLNLGSRNSMVDQTALSNDSYEDFKRQIKQLQQRHLDFNPKRLDFVKRTGIGSATLEGGLQQHLLSESSSLPNSVSHALLHSRRSTNHMNHPAKRSTSSSSPLSSPSSYARETVEERLESMSSPEGGPSRLLHPMTELSNGTDSTDHLLSASPLRPIVNSSSSPVSATSRSSSPVNGRPHDVGDQQRSSVSAPGTDSSLHPIPPSPLQELTTTPSDRLVSTSSVNCPSPSSRSSSLTSSSPSNGASNSNCDNSKIEMNANLNTSGSITNLLNNRRNNRDTINNVNIKKRGRSLPDELKDDAYWERRRKNNEAAKRSRDARRAKEDEIAIRAAFLEQENLKLRVEVAALKSETAKLRCLLYNS